jgi:plastocyanin
MKPRTALIVSLFFFSAATVGATGESADKGQQLATDLWKASGGENWAKVKEVHFTFVVEQEGKPLFSAQHIWNVAAGTDEVKWTDKQGKDHRVTVNLAAPPSDDDGKAAYARWVNDSYWLLAPLKIRDRGVKVQADGPKDLNGVTYETLRISFEKVGLTPTDQYVFYLDPKTKLPLAWDYIPASGEGMQATWEKYKTFGGLNFATEHNFKNKTIKLADIKVVTDK